MNRTPEAVAGLIDDLCGKDEFQRTQAAFALGVLGELSVEPLISLLGSPDQDIRMRSAWVLGVIGAAALPALLRLAESESQPMRIEAIRVLGVVGEARALNKLLQGLVDPQPEVAARAARALGKIGDPRAFHPLATALQHPAPNVRFEACRALADLHIADAIPLLRTLAEEDTGKTPWGASVAEAAQRAIDEIASASSAPPRSEEFARVSQLLREQSMRL
jgi:HEAT repeat protein